MVEHSAIPNPTPRHELESEPALAEHAQTLVPGLELATLPPRTTFRLQLGRAALAGAAGIRIDGTPLPTAPNAAAGVDPVLWWIAPNGWLVTSARPGDSVEAGLRAACAGHFAAIVDVSDSLVAFTLDGAAWPALLARGTGLDLRRGRLDVGQCVRTRLANFAVLLRPTSTTRVELVVDRSYAASLRDWVVDAAIGLDVGAHA